MVSGPLIGAKYCSVKFFNGGFLFASILFRTAVAGKGMEWMCRGKRRWEMYEQSGLGLIFGGPGGSRPIFVPVLLLSFASLE